MPDEPKPGETGTDTTTLLGGATAPPEGADAPASAATADTDTSGATGASGVTAPDAGASTKEPDTPAGANDAPKAPEYGAADLTAPDGSTLDAQVLERIAATARARGLSKEAAQAFVEMHDAAERERAAQVRTAVGAWREQSLTHPDIGGGNAAQMEKNLGLAKRAALKFFGEDAMPVFEASGIGNHPTLLAGLVRIGKALGEGTLALPDGNTTPARPKSLADLYRETSMAPKDAA